MTQTEPRPVAPEPAARTDGSVFTPPLKVLAVCDRPPRSGLPTSDGNTLIADEVLRRIAPRCDLTLAWFDEAALAPDDELAARCRALVRLRPASRARALAALATATPISAFKRSSRLTVQTLNDLARDADVVYLHGPGTLDLARRLEVPCVVNEVDPLSLVFGDQLRRQTGVRRLGAAVRRRSAAAAERRAGTRAETYMVVNPDDARELAALLGRDVTAIPNGIAPARRTSDQSRVRRRLCFVGALDYAPNIESAWLLVRGVLPLVRERVPDVEVVLAGRNATAAVRGLARDGGVRVLDNVPDVMDVYAESGIAVFPGGRGRGTRNCVLEALRAGIPVVASTVSARGVARGEHCQIADSPEDVADAVLQLISNPQVYESAERAARSYGTTLPSWDETANRYLAVLSEAATHRAAARTPQIFRGERT